MPLMALLAPRLSSACSPISLSNFLTIRPFHPRIYSVAWDEFNIPPGERRGGERVKVQGSPAPAKIGASIYMGNITDVCDQVMRVHFSSVDTL